MDEFERDFESLNKKMEIAFNEFIYLYHNNALEMVEGFSNFLNSHPLIEDIEYIKREIKHRNSDGYIGETGAELIINREKIRLVNLYIEKVNQVPED